jgi:N-methylhydantoinase B/oxoprolinase/acetone carboxylase alpha subunit
VKYEQIRPEAAEFTPGGLDAVTLEIIRGKLLAIVDEMGLVLARSSMSPVIYEVLDFACGICDSAGQLVAQTNGITVFTHFLDADRSRATQIPRQHPSRRRLPYEQPL